MNLNAVPFFDPTLAAEKLAEVRGFVFDIDGTLALADKRLSGYQPLPGACELLALLRKRGIPHVGFTNGSTKTPQKLSEALSAIGIELDERHTMTPVSVAVDLFQRRRYKRLLVLGGDGVWKPLADAGFDVVGTHWTLRQLQSAPFMNDGVIA